MRNKVPPKQTRGNFVSEWFGHRVYPSESIASGGLSDQQSSRCPFLSRVTGEEKSCVKPVSSLGICTISSASNGPRQDWLVCPYRALDDKLLEQVARRLFGRAASRPLTILPAPTLAHPKVKSRFASDIQKGSAGVLYFQDKLGGEISIAATERSPEFSFDITLIHIESDDGRLSLNRYGILEVQTMDFHGSYRSVVKNLGDALRLHRRSFFKALRENPHWLSERIEGPNIANVFKRTFYQMMLKFQIGADESCAGCVLALPVSVWDSWQKHLGKPEMKLLSDGTFRLRHSADKAAGNRIPAWIYVFDLDSSGSRTPGPIRLRQTIGTDAEAVSYYALKVAPEAATAGSGSADRVLNTIRRRLAKWWPEFSNKEK